MLESKYLDLLPNMESVYLNTKRKHFHNGKCVFKFVICKVTGKCRSIELISINK